MDRFPDLISESGPPFKGFRGKNTHKTIRDVPVYTAVRPQTTTGGVMLRSLPWVVLPQLQVVRLVSFTHFLELRDAGGLYVSTRDLADTMRGKLVDIEASRVLYARIFVYRVLRVITQRCVRAGSPHPTWSTQTVFIDLWLSVTLKNAPMQCLRRR